jgi:hypothetical protein
MSLLVVVLAVLLVAVLAVLLVARLRRRVVGPYERMLESLGADARGALRQLELSADRNWGRKQREAFDEVRLELAGLGYSASHMDGEIVYTDGRRGYEYSREGARRSSF